MKKIIYLFFIVALYTLSSCDNKSFIDDIYMEPQAKFSIDQKEVFQVFESVHFSNKGLGQKFSLWPGDSLHVYGQNGNSGFACNSDGTFSYSYQDPGIYNAVWIASSVNSNGDIIFSVDSVKIKVESAVGGLTSFSLPRISKLVDFGTDFFYESYGNFVEPNRVVCPIPYKLWPNYVRRSLGVKFELGSKFAKLNWKSGIEDLNLISESTIKVFRFDVANQLEPQALKVIASSGNIEVYEVVAMIIPEITDFTINNVKGVITRDVSAFNKFKVKVQLPIGTNKSSLVPSFEIFKNDLNLLTTVKTVQVKLNDVMQTSGVTSVDFTSPVNYILTYSVPGSNNYNYTYKSYFEVSVE